MVDIKKLYFTKQFLMILLLAILLRSIWIITPLEVDESQYVYVANYLKDKFNAPILENLIDKSPIIYFIYMIPLFIINNSFLFYRLYGFLLYFISFFFIILLSYEFSNNKKEAYLSGLIFAFLMAIPLYHGFLNKVEIIYVLFFTISLFFLKKYLNNKKVGFLILSGVLYFFTWFSDPRTFYLSLFHIYYLYKSKEIKIIKIITKISFFLLLISTFVLNFLFKINLFKRGLEIIKLTIHWYNLIPYQHNVYPSYIPLFFAQLTFFIFIIVAAFYTYKKLTEDYKAIFMFCFLYLISLLILPSYGHYVLNIVPLLAILSAKIISLNFRKNKIFTFGLVIVLIVTLISSIPQYPNLNVDSIELEAGPFSSLKEQNDLVNFLNKNLMENESFYNYDWNYGIYWLTNKQDPYFTIPFYCNSNNINSVRILNISGNSMTSVEWYIDKHFKYVLLQNNYGDTCFNLLFENVTLKYIDTMGYTKIYEIIREKESAYNPPKIIPFWFWNGNLTETEITRQIDLIEDIGINEVIIHARSGLKQEYLSDEWFYFVGFTLNELKKRDMRAWIYDEFDWPSGRANGKVLTENPNLRAKNLKIKIIENNRINLTEIKTNKNMIYTILDISNNDINVINKDNCIIDYCIFSENSEKIAIFYKDFGSYVTEFSNEPYIDVLDSEATDLFIELTYEEYFKRFPEYFGTTIMGFFTDEPGLYGAVEEYNAITWTDNFDEIFYEQKGYNLSENLYYIWEDSGEISEKTKIDYFEVLTYTYSKNYFEKLHNWTQKHGVLLTGHIMGEENLWETVIYEGDFFTHQQYFDIYGTDDIFYFNNEKIHPILLDSLKKLYGNRPALTEAFAGYGDNLNIQKVNETSAWLLDNDVNIIVPHAFFYSINDFNETYMPSFFFNNDKLWPYMADYVSEVQSSKHSITKEEIIITYPIRKAWSVYNPNNFDKINELDKKMKNKILDARKSGLKIILVPNYLE